MSHQIAIKVNKVGKSFKLPHQKHGSLKNMVFSILRGGRKSYEKQEVLKNISFEIKKGEFFGIVGRNGSGKSTLLKLLAGVYSPDQGSIQIYGKLTPFIELGVGFNPELTGRENVYLNGALLGFSRNEMDEMYDEIVEFAELDKFMDQSLKNYSSGMQVRLAFSIAIRSNSEVLVLDEVLAVGDYNFQQKCYEYFRQLKKNNKTVILVSHDSNAIQMFCTSALLLENGVIKEFGSTKKVLAKYVEQNQIDQETQAQKKSIINSQEVRNKTVELLKVEIQKNSTQATIFKPHDKIIIAVHIKFNIPIKSPVFGIVIQDDEGGQPILATNTLDAEIDTGEVALGDVKVAIFEIKNIFNDGKYYVSGAIASSDRSILYIRFMNAATFKSVGWQATARGRIYQNYKFKLLNVMQGNDKYDSK